jgi:hypothetical protein
MYWIIAPLKSAWNYVSNDWSFIPIGLRTRELSPFYFVGASCPRLISECVTPKDLVVTSCVGLLKCWFLMHWKVDLMEHFNIQFLLFFTSLNMCLILMKTAVLLLRFWRCWWSWFQLLSRTHGSDSHACKITIMHKVPPRWRSGILTLCQQTMTSLWSSLVA